MPSARSLLRFPAASLIPRILTVFAAVALFPRDAAAQAATVHPAWTLINLRPAGFQPQVSGMQFLSDGRLVLADWNAQRDRGGAAQVPRTYGGRVYVLNGTQGNTPAVTVDTIARGLEDPMGMVIVRDTIYVSGGNTITRLNRSGNNGPVTRIDTVFILPGTPETGIDSLVPQHGRQEWLFGLLYYNGKFYVAPSSLDPSTSGTTQISPNRGTYLEVTPGDGVANKRGSYKIIAMGLRAPTGIGFGPDGRHCVSDNQGEWLPNNKLICLQEGKFYGAKKGPGGVPYAWDTMPETPATVLGVQDEIANSPTAPLYMWDGPYVGQLLAGDVRFGGVQRYFLEKNGAGDLQGAVFVFTGGLEAGVVRMTRGPDGMVYLGMLGGKNDLDGWPAGTSASTWFGLQKLRYNGTNTFEMLAVRSRPGGMEIEFTKPVDPATAGSAAGYTVQTYWFNPSAAYGGGKQNTTTLVPQTVTLSPDQRKVFLALPGLQAASPAQPQRVVYIRLNNVRSAANEESWTPETWYTLNAFGTGNAFDTPVPLGPPLGLASSGHPRPEEGLRTRVIPGMPGQLRVQIPFHEPYTLHLRDVRGVSLRSVRGAGAEERTVSLDGLGVRLLIVEVRSGTRRLHKMVTLP